MKKKALIEVEQTLLDKMGNYRFLIAAKQEEAAVERLARKGILSLTKDDLGRLWAKRIPKAKEKA